MSIVNKTKMMPFRGQASWAKMTSPGGKLSALVAPGANVLILFAVVIYEWVK